jgi:hypothetical protein
MEKINTLGFLGVVYGAADREVGRIITSGEYGTYRGLLEASRWNAVAKLAATDAEKHLLDQPGSTPDEEHLDFLNQRGESYRKDLEDTRRFHS